MWNSEDTFGKNLGCGRNVTLSLKNTVKGQYALKALISLTCQAEVMATRNAVFADKWRKEQVITDSNGGLVTSKIQVEVPSQGRAFM